MRSREQDDDGLDGGGQVALKQVRDILCGHRTVAMGESELTLL